MYLKKIVGIFIVTLLILTAILPVVDTMKVDKNKIVETEDEPCGCNNYGRSSLDWPSTTEIVSTESSQSSYAPSIAVDILGTVHIAWHDSTNYGASGNDMDIFYKSKPLGGCRRD